MKTRPTSRYVTSSLSRYFDASAWFTARVVSVAQGERSEGQPVWRAVVFPRLGERIAEEDEIEVALAELGLLGLEAGAPPRQVHARQRRGGEHLVRLRHRVGTAQQQQGCRQAEAEHGT